MNRPITTDQIRHNLQTMITGLQAELQALQQVEINTQLQTLTNRAVSGQGVKIDDYLGIGKALYVSYTISRHGGHVGHATAEVPAYSYYDLDGNELGSDGFLRRKRTITPAELSTLVQGFCDRLTVTIADLKSEYRRANSIATKHNKLIAQIDAYNDSVSTASEAKII